MVFFVIVFTLVPSGLGMSARAVVSAVDPIAASIEPATAANNAATPVLIHGSGFSPSTTAHLGSNPLTTTWLSATQIRAVVPWGMAPGVHNLLLNTPDQAPLMLTNAFTVTLGLGKWINNGPFGGQVRDLVLQPGNPARLYAAVVNAGLFVSSDGGDNWRMLINEVFPMRIKISPADPNVIYINTSRSIRRSLDGGVSWTTIEPTSQTPGGALAAFPHPSDPAVVYISAAPNMNNYNDEGGAGDLWRSTDHGDTLTPLANVGLNDKQITELAFEPKDATHQTLVAGSISGKIFQSTNAGASWTQIADLHQDGDQYPARIDTLIFNPYGARELWVVKHNPFLPTDWPSLYRSNADLTLWDSAMAAPTGGEHPISITFRPNTIWAAMETGFTSPNAAALDWTALTPAGIPNQDWNPFGFTLFVVDPANPNIVYGATRAQGIYKSMDGGQSWAASNQGLAGVTPYALAVSPDNVDEVYAVSHSDGAAKSIDGGRHWTSLQFGTDSLPWLQRSLVVDPHNPDVVYMGRQCPQDACVRISRDRGETWTKVILPHPAGSTYLMGQAFAVAVDPHHPGRVVVGATFFPTDWDWNVNHPFGAFYYSTDYGLTWNRSDLDPNLVKGSYNIAFAAGDAGVAYAGTDGTGLWKSADSGVTWTRVSWPGCADSGAPNTRVVVHAVITHPAAANEVFATCDIMSDVEDVGGFYRSTDAGLTWTEIPKALGGGETFLFLPSTAGLALYSGGWRSASRSLDGGNTWQAIDGLPAGSVYALAGWADAERAVVYVSTEAGMGAEAGRAAAQVVMPGGTYGLTERLLKPPVYLPIVMITP